MYDGNEQCPPNIYNIFTNASKTFGTSESTNNVTNDKMAILIVWMDPGKLLGHNFYSA